MTPEERVALRAKHKWIPPVREDDWVGHCVSCVEPWPCSVRRLLGALDVSEAKNAERV